MIKHYLLAAAVLATSAFAASTRESMTLKQGWEFSRDNTKWEQVTVPHDWAIYGPFDRSNDLQTVVIEQNGETEATEKTGRTGGLPFIGKGFYRTNFNVPDTLDRKFTLVFDGAMSNPHVTVNGKDVGGWAYGYNSFYLDLPAGLVRPGENSLEVSLENKEQSSRWYPGAGLYRNVKLLTTSRVHVPVWGTYITTPYIALDEASVKLEIKIEGADRGQAVDVKTDIYAPDGAIVATNKSKYYAQGQPFVQSFMVNNPSMWNVNQPNMYKAVTTLSINGEEVDSYTTPFGIRKLEYLPEKGFSLNGEYTKFKGVCLHHDLGALGATSNRSAIRHQIELLKEIGVNAIRTSHNMPDPILIELCDEMGMMVMIEPFDDWSFRPKSANGYGSIFNEWAERDMVNMLHQYRNNPSVVMWSVGNEVPSQWGPDGVSELEFLQGICHREDPTRPVTCGMDQATAVMSNGFAAAVDIPGFNYKPHFYKYAYETLPQKIILGTETASTVSSRGVYKFPMAVVTDAMYDDHQSSSYDTEACFWSNVPDIDFAADDDYPWMIGQFVWTGFDYLGEPYPYDTDAWPSRSSLFGIYDLAYLPKDRAYFYRSQWRDDAETLHVMPHWTWPGREGETTPVMVYTSYPKAELFVNGISQGVRTKADGKDIIIEGNPEQNHFPDKASRETLDRYRLIWDDVTYQPGEIKVVAYDEQGKRVDEAVVKTAGKADHIVLTPNRVEMTADGEDVVYITVQVADKDGNIVPTDTRLVNFKVNGAGKFLATSNGDAASLRPFQNPEMDLFSGAATAIVQAGDKPGELVFKASAKGVKPAVLKLQVK